MKCHICKENIKKGSSHIYACGGAKITSQTVRNKTKYDWLKYNYPIISKHFIHEYYLDKEYSLPMFKDEFEIPSQHILWLLTYFGIKKRSIKESMNKRTIEKRCKTNLERYGVKNPSQNEDIKEKKKRTFIENYGVDNIFKTDEFKDWFSSYMNETYGKGSLPNRYGNMQKWWNEQPENYKKQHMKPANEGYKEWYSALSEEDKIKFHQRQSNALVTMSASKIELRVKEIIENYGIAVNHQFWIKQKSYDLRIKGTNYIIEVNGDFWHANPKFYKPNDLLNHGVEITASELWDKDYQKKILAENYGYAIIYIWENDINNMSDQEILNAILEQIGDRYETIKN